MHPNAVLVYQRYVMSHIAPGAKVLEIGPDADPSTFQSLARDDVEWVTVDLASESPDGQRRWATGTPSLLMTDPYEIPAPSDTFDVVLSSQVIEHVREPWRWMPELARVCRPGGVVATINPVSWPYHEAPVDCWRIYPEGMRALSELAGLTVETSLWESLEPRARSWYPGQSTRPPPRLRSQVKNRVLRLIGWPLPVAFDTVTVARKPE
jgi:SAM-dependent methyltransferase